MQKVFSAAKLPVLDVEGRVKEVIAPTPSRQKPLDDLNSFKEASSEALRAVMAAAALETGMLGDKATVKATVEAELVELAKRRRDNDIHSFFTEDGSLIPIGQLDELQRMALNKWMFSDSVDNVTGPPTMDADVEMLKKIKEF